MSLPQELDRKFLRFALTHFGGLVRSVSRYPKHWLLCAVFLMFLFADIMDLMFRARTTKKSMGSLVLSGWLLHGVEASGGLLSGICVLGVVTHLVCISHEFHELGKASHLKDKALFAANAMSLGYLWALAWLYSVVFLVYQLSPNATTQEVSLGSWVFVMLVTAVSQVAIYKYGLRKYLIESKLVPLQQKKIDDKGDDVYIRARLSMLQEMSSYLEKDPVRSEPTRDSVEESLRIEVRNLNSELSLARETNKQVAIPSPPPLPSPALRLSADVETTLHERRLLEQQLDAVRLENRNLREQLQEAFQRAEVPQVDVHKTRESDLLEELREQQRLCDEARSGFDQKQAELRVQIDAFEQLSEHSNEMSAKILTLQQQLQEARNQFTQISKHTETLSEANQRLKDDTIKTNQRYDTLVEAVKTRMGEWKDKQLASKENERLSANLAEVEAKCAALTVLNEGFNLQLQQLKASDSSTRTELLEARKKEEIFEKEKIAFGAQLKSANRAQTILNEEVEKLKRTISEQQTLITSQETSIKDRYVPKTELETLSQQLEKLQSVHANTAAELKTAQESLDRATTLSRQQVIQIKELQSKLEATEVSVDRLEAQVSTQQRFLDNVGVTELTLQTLRAQLKEEQDRANALNDELQGRDEEMAQEIQKRKRVESKMLALEKANEVAKGSTVELQTTYQAELSALQATNAQLTEVLKEKETEIAQWKLALKEKETTVLEYVGRMKEKEAHIAELTAEITDKQSQITQLINDVKEREAQITQLTNEVKEKEVQIEQLTNEMKEKAVQAAVADEEEKETYVAQLKAKEEEVAQLKETLREREVQAEKIAQLMNALKEKEVQVERFQEEIATLQTSHAGLSTQVANIIQDKELQVQSLRQELSTMKNEEETSKHDLQEEVKELKNSVKEGQERVHELQEKLVSKTAELESLSEQLNALREKFAVLQNSQSAARDSGTEDLQTLQQTIDELEGKLYAYKNQKESELASLQQEIAILTNANVLLSGEVAGLQVELATLREKSLSPRSDLGGEGESDDHVHSLRQEISSLQAANSRLSTQANNVKGNETKLQLLQQELSTLQATSAKLAEEVRGHERTSERVKKIHETQVQEIANLQASNAKLAVDLAKSISEKGEIEVKLQSAQHDLVVLQEELSALQKVIAADESRNTISQLQLELTKTREKLSFAQQEISALQSQLSQQKEQETELQAAQQQLSTLQATNAQFSATIAENEIAIVAQTNLKEQALQDLAALQATNAQLSAQLSQIVGASTEGTQKIAALKEANLQLEAEITTRGEKVQELQARIQTMEQADEAKKQKFQTAVAMAKKAQGRCVLLEADLKKAGLQIPP